MRILGFSKMWKKLSQPEFTTFRYPRGDKDWQIGEQVQIVYKPRSKERKILGIAKIISKEKREFDLSFTDGNIAVPFLTETEAIADGFANHRAMVDYMEKQYGLDYVSLFNKLTLIWVKELRR